MSTTEPTTVARIHAATAAEIYADLAATMLQTTLIDAPVMRGHAATYRSEGDTTTADRLDAIAHQMELDPLGYQLGRSAIGLMENPDGWPFTRAEFRPSGNPGDILDRAHEQLDAAAGGSGRQTVHISRELLERWFGRDLGDHEVADLATALREAGPDSPIARAFVETLASAQAAALVQEDAELTADDTTAVK